MQLGPAAVAGTTRPREVVERYVGEVLNRTPPADVRSVISDPSFAQRVTRLRTAFPDLQVETHALIAEGDLVAGRFTGRGTHLGLFQGVPPTGNAWSAQCTAIYRVEADRIAEAWVNWDLLSLLEQLGAIERAHTASA